MKNSRTDSALRRTSATSTRYALTLTLLASVANGVLAQDEVGAKRGWTVEPTVSLRQTFTDNFRTQTAAASDAITEATVGARVSNNGGALRGFLDYSLTGSLYARHSDANDVRHFLGAAATAELVDGFAFVDLRGSYSQQAISAFGSQSTTLSQVNGNRQDVASVSIAPSLRGRFAGTVRYEARLSHAVTRAKGTDAGDVDNSDASLHLDGGALGAAVNWSADATHSISDYLAGRRTFDTRLQAGINYAPIRELKVGVSAGRERTDITTVDGESFATWGLLAEWAPSERTLLAAKADKRFFGTGHSLRFSHRTPNTVWTFSSSRDISNSSAQGNASFGSAYDLLFRQFGSAEPDAVKRDVLVRNYLQTNGINPNATVVGGFLASAATLQNTQAMSVALVGVRNTITLQASTSRSERADALTTAFDDLSSSRTVRQRGMLLDWSLRLTPASTVSVGGSYQRNSGDLSTQQSTLKSVMATWTSALGARSSVSAGARHASFESVTSPYDENALFAAVRFVF